MFILLIQHHQWKIPCSRLDVFLKSTLQSNSLFGLIIQATQDQIILQFLLESMFVSLWLHSYTVLQNWIREMKFLQKWYFWDFKTVFGDKYFISAEWYATNQWNVLEHREKKSNTWDLNNYEVRLGRQSYPV